MEEEEAKCDCPAGAPAWIMTFSDLMSLLLCFFVLLLTMAETKPKKFKMVSGSMKAAFGVQRTVVEEALPKAESVIKSEYSPGEPQPIQSDVVNQPQAVETLTQSEAEEEAAEKVEELKNTFKQEMQNDSVEIIKDGADIVVRIKEKASFNSGSAALQKSFIPLLVKIVDNIKDLGQDIEISGHTDDVPIRSSKYRSNWDLSTSRSVTMAHALMKVGNIDPRRITVQGHADTRPVAPNTNRENRARNRRVELVIKANKYKK